MDDEQRNIYEAKREWCYEGVLKSEKLVKSKDKKEH